MTSGKSEIARSKGAFPTAFDDIFESFRRDMEDAFFLPSPLFGRRREIASDFETRFRLFLDDDLLDHLRRDRLDVRPRRKLRVGHDRGRVRVHEHDPVALAAECPARLHAGVVELAALSDPDRPGADDQDAA